MAARKTTTAPEVEAEKLETTAPAVAYIANGTITVNEVTYHAGDVIPNVSEEDVAEAIKICLVSKKEEPLN